MSSPVVSIAFAYTSDPVVLALVKEFHVVAVDPTTPVPHTRIGTVIVVPKTAIPTLTAPLVVTIPDYGVRMVEVFAVDANGRQSITTYAPVYGYLPAVTGVAQVTA